MFKTKQELDSHVHDVLSKVKGERERAMRCFSFAKHYAGLREFGAAKRYMEKYLTTNPSNAADALKLMGDFLVETEELDKALEYYKSSWKNRKCREALCRICDLLERGCGTSEDQRNGNQKWFDLLKSTETAASNASSNSFPVHHDLNLSSNSNLNRSGVGTGPPKTGISHHLMLYSNSSINTPSRSFTQAVNGVESVEESYSPKIICSPDRAETQIRNLERRYDDILAKILGSVQRIENDMKDLRGKVDLLSTINESSENASDSTKGADSSSKTNERIDANQNTRNENSFIPNPQLQQVPPYFDYPPNPAFGFGFPFPASPFHNPYFNTNPMLAALYGNPLFGNPLAGAGVPGVPRNGVPPPGAVPLNETSLLAGLLSQNQFIPQTSLSSQPVDSLYPQVQLQAPLTANPLLTEKLWEPSPQVSATDSFGPSSLFANSNPLPVTSISSVVDAVPVSTFKMPAEKNSNISVTQPIVTTPSKIENPETKVSTPATTPVAKKEIKGKTLFPENVVVSNTEKVPTVPSSSYSNILSVTIPPEHRNAGMGNNNNPVNNTHNFQIAAPTFKPLEPNFDNKSEGNVNPFSNIALKASSAISFGDLASSGVATAFGDGKSFFEGGKNEVFANVVASQSAAGDAVVRHDKDRVDGDEGADDFIPTAEFQPVIPLPPLVEVKKGNENENALFEHRAKIYRFVKETKEWKERGVGNIMILQDKDNDRKIRVVMWRERVYKLACNHLITKDLVIEYHLGSTKVLKWTALDFAEQEQPAGKVEIFTCRFGQEDKCAEFKSTMERMIAFLATQGDSSPIKEKVKEVAKPKEEPKPLSEIFKKPSGSWDCETCYVNNPAKDNKCLSCGTPKPFAFQPAFGQMISKEEKKQEISKPLFTNPDNKIKELNAEAFSSINLAASAAPSFGDLAKNAASTGFPCWQSGKAFVGSGLPVFGNLTTPVQSSPGVASGVEGKESEEAVEEFVPTAEFQPVIPLPPLVEVKKGNENENSLFEHRAKIYRFVKETKEWKERGVGNIMVLQDKDNDRKIRVVMWRERVYKLACNHLITKDLVIEYHQGSTKVLKWTALDFADQEQPDGKMEIFTCRFGQEDKCAGFKAVMERMIAFLATQGDSVSQKKESIASKENVQQKSLFEQFKKPEGSWDCPACYINNREETVKCVACGTFQPGHTCPGCRGCDPDSFDFSALDRRVLPTYPKEPIRKIGDPAAGNPPERINAPKCTPVTESQLYELLTPAASPKKTESTSISAASTTAVVPPQFKFGFSGISNSSNANTVISPPKFNFQFTPTQPTSAPDTSVTNPVAKPTQFKFGFSEFANNPPTTAPFKFELGKLDSNLGSTTTYPTPSIPITSDIFVPSVVSQNMNQQISSTSMPQYGMYRNEEDNDQDDDDDDDDDDDNDEEDAMFDSDAQLFISESLDTNAEFDDLGNGLVRIIYDGEQFCSRLYFIKDDECLIDHIIAAETELVPLGNLTFEWSGVSVTDETAVKIKMRVKLPDQQAYDTFSCTMAESTDFAVKANVTEGCLLGDDEGSGDD